MAIHFTRSIRRLEADSARRTFLILGSLSILVILWATWLVEAQVSVYASTGVARLEVDRENHPVDAPVIGRVSGTHLVAGQRVKAGDLLLELDANPERLERSKAIAKLAPSATQLRSLQDELSAEQRAIDVERRSAEAATAEALAKAQEASSAA